MAKDHGLKTDSGTTKPVDFFISYTGKDKTWAEWIAWTLEEASYHVLIQAWDFHATSNFVLKMQKGATEATRTIAVMSPNYFESAFTKPEWAAAFAQDPTSENAKLIAVRIADFKPPGMFNTIVYIDLVGIDEAEAKKKLISSIANIVKGTRMKPSAMPSFPGGKAASAKGAPPAFPGKSNPPTAPIHNLPFSTNQFFTDGNNLLQKLHEALSQKTAAAITQPQAVHGLGGVGKTQLAVEYAWRHLDDYDAVLWVGVETPALLQANLAQLADLLHLPEADAKEQAVKVQGVLNWLRANTHWLLILDNADTNEAAEAVKHILPPGLRGHVIVTSRRANWPNRFADLEVNVLPPDAAAELLINRSAKRGFTAGDKVAANAIAHELGCLPLALEQAGAYIDKHHISFKAYLELLKASRLRVLGESGEGGTDYQKTVATTWLVSEAQLSSVAKAILQMAAFLAPDDIPRALFMADGETMKVASLAIEQKDLPEKVESLDNLAIENALAELADHSLVELETDSFSCHRLLQAVLLDRLNSDDRKQWGQMVVSLVNIYAPEKPSDVRTWPIWNKLRPHVTQLLKTIGEDADNNTSPLMNQLGLHLKAKALYNEAEPLYRRAVAIDEKSFGTDNPTIALRLNNLAQLLKETNRLAEAELLMRRAVDILEKSSGPEHPHYAVLFNNLAQLLQAANRFAEAEPLMQQALAIAEKDFGPEHPTVALRLNNMAQLLHNTNRLVEAEPLMRRALAIDEKNLDPEHPNIAIRLNNLALLLQKTNRLTEAEPLMRRALAIDDKSFGPEHPNTARDLNNLALMLKDTDRLPEAEPLARRAAGIMIRSLGSEHPNTKIALGSYEGILTDMKLSQSEIEARMQSLTKQ